MQLENRASEIPARTLALVAFSALVSGALLGLAALLVTRDAMPKWLLARAGGITAYLLLTLVTVVGLWLSHRGKARLNPHPSNIRLHVALVVFTLAFTVLHVVVLAIDEYAKVGIRGALIPMASEYKPVGVTLGLIALWSALISTFTAAFAGRFTGRIWLALHRVAGLAWLLAWIHSVLVGVDTPLLVGMYAFTGISVMLMAAWRYVASRTHLRMKVGDRDPQVLR